jgi:stearoyl-CoA desaturase (delta-9 desaturase)
MVIAIFFLSHWALSLFCQTFFLHRYGSHRMFTMSKGWERFFYFLTFLTQGSSFLIPRAYAILHRMHHAYSDTPKDPHSPNNGGFIKMMTTTWTIYHGLVRYQREPEARFEGGYPEWKALDKIGQSYITATAFGVAYGVFYIAFATSPWMFALVPIHIFMGVIHGGIVNWCGHRYGYRNFDSDDDSKNMLIFDFLTGGELFQNNHHKYGMSPNFAVRWFEIDPSFQVMRVLAWFGIIDFGKHRQVTRYPEAQPQPQPSPEA